MLETLKNIAKDKKQEKLIYLLVMLIVIFIAFSVIFKDNNSQVPITSIANTENKSINKIDNSNYTNSYIMQLTTYTENKLQDILNNIEGISEASVMVTYASLDEITALSNKEANGNETAIYNEENGKKSVVVQSTKLPQVQGVIVVAKGVTIATKTDIANAISNITGAPSHKINIFNKG